MTRQPSSEPGSVADPAAPRTEEGTEIGFGKLQRRTSEEGIVQRAPVQHKLARRGARGRHVALLQHQLNFVGYGEELPEDGIFGRLTETAVEWFQSQEELKPDGIVGPLTSDALNARVKQERTSLGLESEAASDLGVVAGFGPGYAGAGGAGSSAAPTSKPSTKTKCKYEPGERERKRTGEVEPGEPGGPPPSALMFDFHPKKAPRGAELLPKHRAYLDKAATALKRPPAGICPAASILGYTDCVSQEVVNHPLRLARAYNVYQYLKHKAPGGAYSWGEATQGSMPGNDSSEKGRSRNRAVRVKVTHPKCAQPIPPAPAAEGCTVPRRKQGDVVPGGDPDCPGCVVHGCNPYVDMPSRRWAIRVSAFGSAGFGPTGGLLMLVLANRTSGCQWSCTVLANMNGGGAVGGANLSPFWYCFTTPKKIRPSFFDKELVNVAFHKMYATGDTPQENAGPAALQISFNFETNPQHMEPGSFLTISPTIAGAFAGDGPLVIGGEINQPEPPSGTQ